MTGTAVSIQCITFNSAAMAVAATDTEIELQASALLEDSLLSTAGPHLIVVGLQELCSPDNSYQVPPPPIPMRSLAPQGYPGISGLLDSIEWSLRSTVFRWDFQRFEYLLNRWQRALQRAIDKRFSAASYRPINRKPICSGPTAMLIFALDSIKLSAIHRGFVNCGWLGGRGWNKAAVCCCIDVAAGDNYASSRRILFINAHMAAHEGNCDRRNMDYQKIMERLSLHDDNSPGLSIDWQSIDACCFMGDLNYRLSAEKTDRKYFQNNPDESWLIDRFLPLDELKEQQRLQRAFSRFHEAPIRFPPTYKFNRSGQYDTRKRMPAWCDRCLFINGSSVKIFNYDVPCSSRQLAGRYSDHLPVMSRFEVSVNSEGKNPISSGDSKRLAIRINPLWDYLVVLLVYLAIRCLIVSLILYQATRLLVGF